MKSAEASIRNIQNVFYATLSYGIGGGAIVDGDHLFEKDGKVGSDVEAVLAKIWRWMLHLLIKAL